VSATLSQPKPFGLGSPLLNPRRRRAATVEATQRLFPARDERCRPRMRASRRPGSALPLGTSWSARRVDSETAASRRASRCLTRPEQRDRASSAAALGRALKRAVEVAALGPRGKCQAAALGGRGRLDHGRGILRAGSWAVACTVAAEGVPAYPRPMRNGVGAAIDGRLEALIVKWVRRQWPVLRLVPARCIRPVTKPTVLRLRRSLSRSALTLAVPVGTILALLILAQ